jgi:hypothetical protein
MTDDELHEAIAANLPTAGWTTVVYRRNGLRRVKSTRDVAGATAVALTLIPDGATDLEVEDAIDLHAHRAIADTADLIVLTAPYSERRHH